jgi:hypothetical protein
MTAPFLTSCPRCNYPMRDRHAGYMVEGMGADHYELVRPVCPSCGEEGASIERRPFRSFTSSSAARGADIISLSTIRARNDLTTPLAARPSEVIPVARVSSK